MPRWPAGLHLASQSLRAAGGRYRAVPSIPLEAYTRRLTDLPLSGGQAQAIVPGAASGTGTANAPVAFTQFLILGPYQPGTYTINWTLTLSGTVGAGDANNVRLNWGDPAGAQTILATSVNAGAAGNYPQAAQQLTLTAPAFLIVKNIGAGTAGSVYAVTITVAGRVGSVSVTIGPQGLGTTWYPAQVTMSTTTGPLDTSTALAYLGPLTTPSTLVGQVYTGNGTMALAIPSMQPGQFLIVTWENAAMGDTVAANVIGVMEALST